MEAEECNTGLYLGLGLGEYTAAARKERPKDNNKHPLADRTCLDLSFKLCPNNDEYGAGDEDHKLISGSSLETGEEEDGGFRHKIYELNNNNNNNSRKKLRLTMEQSSLLEDSFKLHTTLNSSQKQALAEQLNLKPRQVEVWFQNRRARTKLKQTVVDCEFLKKCCENLTEENKRLKKELRELQSIKAVGGSSSPLFIQLQKARRCTSCEKIVRTSNEGKKCGRY